MPHVYGAFLQEQRRLSLLQADEPAPPELADGFGACDALDTRVNKELDAWAREQPKVPFKPEREETLLGGPWVDLTRAIARSSGVIAATLLPSLGAQTLSLIHI